MKFTVPIKWKVFCIHVVALLIISVHLSEQTPQSSEFSSEERPFYKECTKSDDCPEDYCCVLGMMRYQMPHCFPIGHRNDPCHPYQDGNYRENYTLNFPNGEVRIEESWTLMCPCDQGLHCSKHNATCVPLGY